VRITECFCGFGRQRILFKGTDIAQLGGFFLVFLRTDFCFFFFFVFCLGICSLVCVFFFVFFMFLKEEGATGPPTPKKRKGKIISINSFL